jgi:hypothetical protein
MTDIYSFAKILRVWLEEEDSSIDPAFELLDKFRAHFPNRADRFLPEAKKLGNHTKKAKNHLRNTSIS